MILAEKGLDRYIVLREKKKLTRSDGKQWTDHLKSDFKGGGGAGGGEKQNKTARENVPPPQKKSQVKPTWGGGVPSAWTKEEKTNLETD